MMSFYKKSWVYLVVIFIAGGMTGGFVGFSLAMQKMSRPLDFSSIGHRVEHQLTGRLGLDAGQQERLGPLIEETMNRIVRIYVSSINDIESAVGDAQMTLVKDLRPDQIERLNAIAKSRYEFIQQHTPLLPSHQTEESHSAE